MNRIIFEMQKLSNIGLHDKFAIVDNVAHVSSNILFRTIENIITKRANRTATIEHFTEIIQNLQDIMFVSFNALFSPYVVQNYRFFNTMSNINLEHLDNVRKLDKVVHSSLHGIDVLLSTYNNDIHYCRQLMIMKNIVSDTHRTIMAILREFTQ